MFNSRNFLSGKRKYLTTWLLFLFVYILCLAFSMAGNDSFDFARREVMLRRIGHEVLLQSGDSTSRVLPVKKIAESEYRISFENAFTFRPDSLVNTTRRLLGKDPLTSEYVVNVLNCANDSVTYGYAISKNRKDDIIACFGRRQPRACYMINIKFKPADISSAKNVYFLDGLLFLGFGGFIFLRPGKPQKVLPELQDPLSPASQNIGSPELQDPELPETHDTELPENENIESPESQNTEPPGIPNTDIFTLGSMSFNAQAHKLMVDGKTIDLTRTETRVLRIFALNPNEAIERSRLQKEIWEDEGVIVGRSLDMFISKLRKKLKSDPNIQIVVIRGKGYKLEIRCTGG